MAYWLTSFNGTTLPTNLGDRGSHDIAAGAVAAPLISLPGGRVFDPLGSELAYRPSANIVANVLLMSSAAGGLEGILDIWQAKIGEVGLLTRTGGTSGRVYSITARLLSASSTRNTTNRNHLPMTLVFQVISFPWQGAGVSYVQPTAAISGHLYSGTLTNNGNVTQKTIQFFITTSNGAIMTNFAVQNTTTGHLWQYTGTIPNAKTVFIETALRMVLSDYPNAASADYAHFTPPTNSEDWFVVAAGVNTFNYVATFTGGTGSAQVDLTVGFADAIG